MKGQDAIIQLRLQGKSPEWVFVNDFPCKTNWVEHDDYATVCVYGDPLKTLDMRFLIGLNVIGLTESEKRSKELFDALQRVSTKSLTVSNIDLSKHFAKQDVKVWQK
jgi:hypothetical protein